MDTSELLAILTQQGIQVWADTDKLNICSPKGILTPKLYAELVAHKVEILAFLYEIDMETLAQRLAEEAEIDISESEIFEI